MPARFHLSLFRLFAYFQLKSAAPEPKPGIVLAIERHQDAAENYLDGLCTLIVIAAYIASLLASTFPLATAIAIALPATVLFISANVVFTGFLIAPIFRRFIRSEDEPGIVVNSAVWMIITVACATLLTVSPSPLRHIGTIYLLLVAANAAAAVIVLLMQRSFADLERRYGVEP